MDIVNNHFSRFHCDLCYKRIEKWKEKKGHAVTEEKESSAIKIQRSWHWFHSLCINNFWKSSCPICEKKVEWQLNTPTIKKIKRLTQEQPNQFDAKIFAGYLVHQEHISEQLSGELFSLVPTPFFCSFVTKVIKKAREKKNLHVLSLIAKKGWADFNLWPIEAVWFFVESNDFWSLVEKNNNIMSDLLRSNHPEKANTLLQEAIRRNLFDIIEIIVENPQEELTPRSISHISFELINSSHFWEPPLKKGLIKALFRLNNDQITTLLLREILRKKEFSIADKIVEQLVTGSVSLRSNLLPTILPLDNFWLYQNQKTLITFFLKSGSPQLIKLLLLETLKRKNFSIADQLLEQKKNSFINWSDLELSELTRVNNFWKYDRKNHLIEEIFASNHPELVEISRAVLLKSIQHRHFEITEEVKKNGKAMESTPWAPKKFSEMIQLNNFWDYIKEDKSFFDQLLIADRPDLVEIATRLFREAIERDKLLFAEKIYQKKVMKIEEWNLKFISDLIDNEAFWYFSEKETLIDIFLATRSIPTIKILIEESIEKADESVIKKLIRFPKKEFTQWNERYILDIFEYRKLQEFPLIEEFLTKFIELGNAQLNKFFFQKAIKEQEFAIAKEIERSSEITVELWDSLEISNLLCSKGFWLYVEKGRIIRQLLKMNQPKISKTLLREALRNEAFNNADLIRADQYLDFDSWEEQEVIDLITMENFSKNPYKYPLLEKIFRSHHQQLFENALHQETKKNQVDEESKQFIQ